jgi:prolipoprotein diacylglyceryl transferase
VLFGGLTVGSLTALWLVRRHGADLGAFAGAAAVGIPLAQALGRPADYFSQELFGTPSSLPWAVEIPERLRPAAYVDAATFHPAFLYEALWSAATVGVLLVLERRGILDRGRLFLGYLVAYGTGRFALELIRTDTTFRLLGISRNGWIAAGLVIAGTIGMRATRTRGPAASPEPVAPLVGVEGR